MTSSQEINIGNPIYAVDIGHLTVATMASNPVEALADAELWGQDNARKFGVDPSSCCGTVESVDVLHGPDVAALLVINAALELPYLLGFRINP